MRIRFDGKTVAVSGAGHGFGRCIAETFAQRGARVFGCDLSAAELVETATAGVEAEVVDLSDRVAAAAWIARIEQTTGGAVDVLVNNAGGVAGQEMHPIEEVEDADWDRIFAVNIGAAFALSRASRKSGSQQTPCWREQDSNHRSRLRKVVDAKFQRRSDPGRSNTDFGRRC